jgi:hypothetical protein
MGGIKKQEPTKKDEEWCSGGMERVKPLLRDVTVPGFEHSAVLTQGCCWQHRALYPQFPLNESS